MRSRLELKYTLTDGRTLTRDYNFTIPKEDGQGLKELLSRPEFVLGEAYNAQWLFVEHKGEELSAQQLQSLREAKPAGGNPGRL